MTDDERQKQSQAMDAATPKAKSTKDMSSFDYMKSRINKLIQQWNSYTNDQVKKNRAYRYINTDKETLKTYGLFKEDETYVPVRLIDQNIRAEQPQYIAYITQSRRACVLESVAGLTITGLEKVEKLFTDHARYLGWERPFIRVVDGQSTHGWDWQEVEFDSINYPGHFCLHHVGHEKLMFDFDTEDIQNQEYICKQEEWTAMQLKNAIEDEGFIKSQVDKIIESNKDKDQDTLKDISFSVYKVFYKKDKIVYIGYYGGDITDGWLKEPLPLYLGRNDINAEQIAREDDPNVTDFPPLMESEYPFYPLYYIESEDPKITNLKGRAFLDFPSQEAAGAIMSSMVNGTMRASNVYGSPKQPVGLKDGTPAKVKQTSVVLQHGKLYDEAIEFFHTEYPPASVLSNLQAITTANKAEISRVDIAAQNRKDSRKTAEEIKSTDQTAAMLSTVQVTNLSVFMRSVYGRAFTIWKNRILQGKIEVDEQVKKILATYELIVKSAGDVDVIQKQEKLARQQQSWPVISKIPGLNMEFLKDILRTAFPEDAQRYINIIDQQEQTKSLVQGLAALVRELVMDENGKLKPEYAQFAPQLLQLQNQVTNYLIGENQQDEQSTQSAGPAEQEATAGYSS